MKPKTINFGHGIEIYLEPNFSKYAHEEVIYVDCEIHIDVDRELMKHEAIYFIPKELQFYEKVKICDKPLESDWGSLFRSAFATYRWEYKRFYASTWIEAATAAQSWGCSEIQPLLDAIAERQAKIEAVGQWIVPDDESDSIAIG